MKPRSAFTGTCQLFQAHSRARLAHRIDWPRFDATVADNDRSDGGAPVKAMPMRVGPHNPKIAFNESHELVVARGFENPDGQYFCGFTHLQPHAPPERSSLRRSRTQDGPARRRSEFHRGLKPIIFSDDSVVEGESAPNPSGFD